MRNPFIIIGRNRFSMPLSAVLKTFIICSATVLLIPGCLITTQSFNHGKLLNPGERLLTHGIGGRYSAPTGPRDQFYDSAEVTRERRVYDSKRYNWATYTFDYRVGILRKYPFGKGLETGFHCEVALRKNSSDDIQLYGPPALEFDTRFGLNDITIGPGIFHHNVNAGWIVGYWVDNGWFGGYAAGWEIERFIPYISTRILLTATNVSDQPITNDFFTRHNRKVVGRINLGCTYRLPFNTSVVPDMLTPEISFTFPNYANAQQVGVNAAIGIRWILGQ